MLPIIGILLGEAAGIGPELIAKLCSNVPIKEKCRPLLIGDKCAMEQGMEISGTKFPINYISDFSEAQFGESIDFIDLHILTPSDYCLGEISIRSGHATYLAMKYALDLRKEKCIDGLVYGPQNKESFYLAGHSLDSMDFMCQYLNIKDQYGELNVLDNLWTTRVTSHIPLKDVSKTITRDSIVRIIRFANECIRKSGIKNPRIAVTGINPHNGENGLCGIEEKTIIEPAVKTARQENINVFGPFSADTLFIRAFRGEFDIVVTMYHDQGQIAMKLKDFSNIVTLIGGLDFPVATPAHGTAFDIVGKGIANVAPIRHALDLVCGIATNHGFNQES
jgi:4-hydroxy-L-threonine phosphate dehydrogenase PdxA